VVTRLNHFHQVP